MFIHSTSDSISPKIDKLGRFPRTNLFSPVGLFDLHISDDESDHKKNTAPDNAICPHGSDVIPIGLGHSALPTCNHGVHPTPPNVVLQPLVKSHANSSRSLIDLCPESDTTVVANIDVPEKVVSVLVSHAQKVCYMPFSLFFLVS